VPLTARERAAFSRIVETVVAPRDPLPRVGETDAVAAFDALLAASPRINRAVLRGAVLLIGRRPRLVRRLDPLRATAAMAYYGDPQVQRLLGYDP
jgi:hypothetical protein